MEEKNYVYMIRCGNGSLYTGWTNDLSRRIRAHRTGKGAKYTRGFGAKGVVYLERMEDKSAALRREARPQAEISFCSRSSTASTPFLYICSPNSLLCS